MRIHLTILAYATVAICAHHASAQIIGQQTGAAAQQDRPSSALFKAKAARHASELRAAWLASGHGAPLASTAPVMTAGKILTPSINVTKPPAAPAAQVTYSAPNGVEEIFLQYNSSTTSQYVWTVYDTSYAGSLPTSGTVQVQSSAEYPMSRYAAPGRWTLTAAQIFDQTGQSSFYSGTALARVFPGRSVTVTNPGTSDTAAPTVTGGKILTPTVSLSGTNPVFAVSMNVTDNLSGVSIGQIFVSPPGTTDSYSEYYYAPSPVLSGSVNGIYAFYAGDQTGTYTISGYGVCDVAMNCFQDFKAADIKGLFGTTTFQVTN